MCWVCVAQLTHRKMPTSPENTCDVKKWKDDGRGVSNPTLHSASSRHGRRKPLHKRWYVSRGQRKGCLKKYFSLSAPWGWWKGQCKCHGACDKGGQRRPEKRVWWEMCASLCPQIQGEYSIRKTPGAVLVSSYPQPQKGFAWNSMPWLIPCLVLRACASGQHREPVQVKLNISCTLVESSGLRWWEKSPATWQQAGQGTTSTLLPPCHPSWHKDVTHSLMACHSSLAGHWYSQQAQLTPGHITGIWSACPGSGKLPGSAPACVLGWSCLQADVQAIPGLHMAAAQTRTAAMSPPAWWQSLPFSKGTSALGTYRREGKKVFVEEKEDTWTDVMLPCMVDLMPCAEGKRKHRPQEQQVNVKWKSSVKAPSTDGGARSSTLGYRWEQPLDQSTPPHPTPLSWPYPASGLCHGSVRVGFKRGPSSSDVGINVTCPFWALRLAPVCTSRCLRLQGLCPASKNSEEQQRVTSSPNFQMPLQIC